jgi:hypothetical protein
VIAAARAAAAVLETLDALNDTIAEITPPEGVSVGMIERLRWNMRRLLAGDEISEPKR